MTTAQSHSVIDEIKTRAAILRKELGSEHRERAAAAARRFQRLARYEARDVAAILAARDELSHGESLAVVAGEAGYPSWEEMHAELTARCPDADASFAKVLGRRLYPTAGAGFNNWFRCYPEARDARRAHGGYLLPYEKHFFVCEAGLIERLGLDPTDADWERIDWDWARPRDLDAWRRLNAQVWNLTPTERC